MTYKNGQLTKHTILISKSSWRYLQNDKKPTDSNHNESVSCSPGSWSQSYPIAKNVSSKKDKIYKFQESLDIQILKPTEIAMYVHTIAVNAYETS